jgi:hypothetical protein
MDNLARQPCSVDKWRHLDFQGRDPTVVILGSAELAVVAPEHPAGFLPKLLRALTARQPASIVYLGHECDLLDVGSVVPRTSVALQGPPTISALEPFGLYKHLYFSLRGIAEETIRRLIHWNAPPFCQAQKNLALLRSNQMRLGSYAVEIAQFEDREVFFGLFDAGRHSCLPRSAERTDWRHPRRRIDSASRRRHSECRASRPAVARPRRNSLSANRWHAQTTPCSRVY